MKTALVTIYRATTPRGCYVGQTRAGLAERKRQHLGAARRGDHVNPRFGRALMKYGDRVKWEVVAKVIPEWAVAAEQNAILASNALHPKGYNLKGAGSVGTFTAATRKKLSESMTGRVFTKSHRAALSAANRRRAHPPLSEAHKAQISKSLAGRPAHNRGKPMKQAQKDKISQSLLARRKK